MNDTGIEYKQWGLSAPEAVLLLVHGLGAHAGRWDAMGDFFLKRGVASYAVELGNLRQQAGLKPDFVRTSHDRILGLYDIAVRNNPEKKIFLAGESMGGLIAFLLTADRPDLFAGLVCISPAFASMYKPALPEILKMAAALFYNPGKQFAMPFTSAMCTHDPDCLKKMDADPREYRTVSSKLIMEILLAQARARAVKDKIKTSTLFLVAGEDKIADARATGAIFAALTVKDKALIEFPGMYHSLSIELGKESVFEEIFGWIKKRDHK